MSDSGGDEKTQHAKPIVSGGGLLVLPHLFYFLIFFIYPLFKSLSLATHQSHVGNDAIFVGLANFVTIWNDPSFFHALRNTVIYSISTLLCVIPLSLLLAYALYHPKVKAASLFRFIIFSPHIVGPIFVGIIFSTLFLARYGVINQLLHFLFGMNPDVQILEVPSLVMPALIVASVWMQTGFGMIYFMAAFQNCDRDLVDAASLDGANHWDTFCYVFMPLAKPVLIFVLLTHVMQSLQLFELPYAMLKGQFGPGESGLTLVGYLYERAFIDGHFGIGAAVAWVLAVLTFVLSFIQIRFTSRFKE